MTVYILETNDGFHVKKISKQDTELISLRRNLRSLSIINAKRIFNGCDLIETKREAIAAAFEILLESEDCNDLAMIYIDDNFYYQAIGICKNCHHWKSPNAPIECNQDEENGCIEFTNKNEKLELSSFKHELKELLKKYEKSTNCSYENMAESICEFIGMLNVVIRRNR